MSNVCLLNAVLLCDAVEATLGRALTPDERQDILDVRDGAVLAAAERELERVPDPAAAASVLERLRTR